MKLANRTVSSALLVVTCLALVACSGVPGGNSGGGGAGSTFTISAKVTGLSGMGLVLANNATDQLPITTNGTYAFKKKVTGYAVTVVTQPTNPQQTCGVTGGTGTATANTTVTVTCTAGSYSVGGQVSGLVGSGLVLQNNGKDNLTITTNGAFTFATPANLNDPYSITVLTQPTKPSQVCSVANGSGTVTQNVGLTVVNCTVGTIPIGVAVSGLAGGGLVLQNNGGDNLTIAGNGNFTFPTLLVSGQTYNVSIYTQPPSPPQVCTISNNTGAASPTMPQFPVSITCPPVFESIIPTVVGLSIPKGGPSQQVLQNNLGDNLPAPTNGQFTFATEIPYGNPYDVTVFVAPGTQSQGYIRWNYSGIATAPVTDVTIDWGHNDWSWINGSSSSNQHGAWSKPTPPVTSFVNNSPGGREYAATWTDANGSLWLYGGFGYTYNTQIGPQPFFLDETWEYSCFDNSGNALGIYYFGGLNCYWLLVSPLPPPAAPATTPGARWASVTWTDASGKLWLFGGQDGGLDFLNDLWVLDPTTGAWSLVSGGNAGNGTYGTLGSGSTSNLPGGRWGSTARIDASGNVWLFGGFGYDATSKTPGLLNDLWKYNVASGAWTWVSGSNQINQNGLYAIQGTPGNQYPGGRQAAVSWLDKNGNFWMFGGYNLSATGTPNAFNDLWEYSGGQWNWVSGSSTINQLGTYGTQGVSAATNVPGSRWASAAWTDVSGNLWLFAGQGYDPSGNSPLTDLWAFNPNAPGTPVSANPYLPTPGQWVWVKGPSSFSQTGVYGIDPSTTFGSFWPHVTNYPGSRFAPAYWYVPNGLGEAQFFMFGGEGYDSSSDSTGNGMLNDLWRYLPYP